MIFEILLKLGCTMTLTRMSWLRGQMHADADPQTRPKPHINKISNIICVLPLICFAVQYVNEMEFFFCFFFFALSPLILHKFA